MMLHSCFDRSVTKSRAQSKTCDCYDINPLWCYTCVLRLWDYFSLITVYWFAYYWNSFNTEDSNTVPRQTVQSSRFIYYFLAELQFRKSVGSVHKVRVMLWWNSNITNLDYHKYSIQRGSLWVLCQSPSSRTPSTKGDSLGTPLQCRPCSFGAEISHLLAGMGIIMNSAISSSSSSLFVWKQHTISQ